MSRAINEDVFYWNRTNGQEIESNELLGPITDHNENKDGMLFRYLGGRIYFCIRRILSTKQCLILYKDLGVKSRKKFVYMKGQHNDEFCIHMSSRCIHLYTHFGLNLGH